MFDSFVHSKLHVGGKFKVPLHPTQQFQYLTEKKFDFITNSDLYFFPQFENKIEFKDIVVNANGIHMGPID